MVYYANMNKNRACHSYIHSQIKKIIVLATSLFCYLTLGDKGVNKSAYLQTTLSPGYYYCFKTTSL